MSDTKANKTRLNVLKMMAAVMYSACSQYQSLPFPSVVIAKTLRVKAIYTVKLT